jgi:hypothetical protein
VNSFPPVFRFGSWLAESLGRSAQHVRPRGQSPCSAQAAHIGSVLPDEVAGEKESRAEFDHARSTAFADDLQVCPSQVSDVLVSRVGAIAGAPGTSLRSPKESARAAAKSQAPAKKGRTSRYSATPMLYPFLLFPATHYGVADL